MVSRGNTAAHQREGAAGSIPCPPDLCGEQERHPCPPENGQHHSSVLRQQHGRHTFPSTSRTDMDWAMDRDMTLTAEYLPGRLNVRADHESRLRGDSYWTRQIMKMVSQCDVDLFAQVVNSATKVHELEARPRSILATDALNQPWGNINSYALADREMPVKDQAGRSAKGGAHSTPVDSTTMVPRSDADALSRQVTTPSFGIRETKGTQWGASSI